MKTKAVVPFYFHENEIRTITIDEEPWFVAKDICLVLGLENATKALLKVPEYHKGVNSIQTPGGTQQLNTVDEPGLYRLILRSDKPQAEPLMEWVTEEVLPSIRQTGGYGTVNDDELQRSPLVQHLLVEERHYFFKLLYGQGYPMRSAKASVEGTRQYVVKGLCLQVQS